MVRLVILYFNKILKRVGLLSQLQFTVNHQNCSFQFSNYNHRLIFHQNFCLFLGWKILFEFTNTIKRSYYYDLGTNRRINKNNVGNKFPKKKIIKKNSFFQILINLKKNHNISEIKCIYKILWHCK